MYIYIYTEDLHDPCADLDTRVHERARKTQKLHTAIIITSVAVCFYHSMCRCTLGWLKESKHSISAQRPKSIDRILKCGWVRPNNQCCRSNSSTIKYPKVG